MIILILTASGPQIVGNGEAEESQATHARLYGLIVAGSTGGSFRNNTAYMYHVFSEHYCFDNITYLSVYLSDPGVNASATKNNIRFAITDTLAGWSNENDTVFIYFSSHGGGYLHHTDRIIEGAPPDLLPHAIAVGGGRYDTSGDEGEEINEGDFNRTCWVLNALYDIRGDGEEPWDWVRNFDDDPYIEIDLDTDFTVDIQLDDLLDLDGDGWSDDIQIDPDSDDLCDIAIDADVNHDEMIDNFISDGEDADANGWIKGLDLNGDGDYTDWLGFDECLQVQDGLYWDDELASDIDEITCAKLIFVRQGCLEGNQSCFGGGLIDDLSAPNRILMSPSNETWYSVGDTDGDGLSEWSEAFINALHGEEAYYNPQTQEIVHSDTKVDADSDGSGYVTLLELWQYAWDNDDARLSGLETPWFDDDGDCYPTFLHGYDNLDYNDGDLANQTVLEPNLETILDKLGFTNIEESTVETFSIYGISNITLYAEFAGGYHMFNNLSWYPVGTTNYDLIFSGAEGRFGYVEPPLKKSFIATCEFGLSFHSPEARYFTETARNPDGIKHAKVYKNLDNPNMFLIGFENLLGGGDKDYNDMVISIETKVKQVMYMQNDKWDSTYWKLYWNNTPTHNTYSACKPGYSLSGYLGVRIYNGSDELTSDVVQVGRWFNLQSEIKNLTWPLSDDVNVTGTYIQVKIYYMFQGDDSWTYMGVTFKTETFTENTILNATRWNIILYGSYYVQGGPLKGPLGGLGGPIGQRSAISFSWGCPARESRIEDTTFTAG